MEIILIIVEAAILSILFRQFKVTFLSPLFYILSIGFVLPFVVSPFVSLFVESDTGILAKNREYMTQALIWINIITAMWGIGYYITGSREKFKWDKTKKKNQTWYRFGFLMLCFGSICYILLWQYLGLDIAAAYNDPLGTRFKIIETTGAYHFRNIGIWSLWAGLYFIYFSRYYSHSRKRKIELSLIFIIILIMNLPFGQRYQIIFPIVIITIALYYDGHIKQSTILQTFPVLIILLLVLGFYREIGRTEDITIKAFSDIFEKLDLLQVASLILSRFNSFEYFTAFVARDETLKMSLSESIESLFGRFLPVSMTGGEKALDIDGYLTKEIFGSFEFGTYSFTVLPEWRLNFGYVGYIVMPILSGMLCGKLLRLMEKTPNKGLLIIFFSDLFLLKWDFIRLNNASNVDAFYFLTYATVIIATLKLMLILSRPKKPLQSS